MNRKRFFEEYSENDSDNGAQNKPGTCSPTHNINLRQWMVRYHYAAFQLFTVIKQFEISRWHLQNRSRFVAHYKQYRRILQITNYIAR